MPDNKYKPNRKGIGEVLQLEFADTINDLANKIADQVRADVGEGVEVVVDTYTTDRGAASITIADPDGLAIQASTGALTRAAAANGLEVTSK